MVTTKHTSQTFNKYMKTLKLPKWEDINRYFSDIYKGFKKLKIKKEMDLTSESTFSYDLNK